MGLFLGDDAAKNLPEERVFETDGVSCLVFSMRGGLWWSSSERELRKSRQAFCQLERNEVV